MRKEKEREGGERETEAERLAGGLAARRVCARECGRVPVTEACGTRAERQPVGRQPRGSSRSAPPRPILLLRRGVTASQTEVSLRLTFTDTCWYKKKKTHVKKKNLL